MDTTHTPEPWRVDHNGFTLVGNDVVLGSLGGCPGTSSQEDDANAARIVACVNAMAGIKDPEGASAALHALLLAVGHDPTLSQRKYAGHPIVQAASRALRAMGGAL